MGCLIWLGASATGRPLGTIRKEGEVLSRSGFLSPHDVTYAFESAIKSCAFLPSCTCMVLAFSCTRDRRFRSPSGGRMMYCLSHIPAQVRIQDLMSKGNVLLKCFHLNSWVILPYLLSNKTRKRTLLARKSIY